MFYSGNPTNPNEYNPVNNLDQSNDLNTLRPIETSVFFGQSVTAGDRIVNSIIAPIISGGNLNITGPSASYIYGPINSQLTLVGGAKFPDGSAANPSITFINDDDTGIYRGGDGIVSFTSNGTNVVNVGTSLQLSVPITTPGVQDLVLNPGGTNVNFSGHTIFNAVFPPTGVVPGSYVNTNITVNAAGFVTAASNGTGGPSIYSGKFQLVSNEITVNNTIEINVAYMPWRFASWSGTTTRSIHSWIVPGSGTRSLTLRVRDFAGTLLGSFTVNGGQPTGIYTFTITLPSSDTRISFSTERSAGVGTSPVIYGVIFEAT